MKRKRIAVVVARSPFCPQLSEGNGAQQFGGIGLDVLTRKLAQVQSPSKRLGSTRNSEVSDAKRQQRGAFSPEASASGFSYQVENTTPPGTPQRTPFQTQPGSPPGAHFSLARRQAPPPPTPARGRVKQMVDSPTVNELRTTGVFSPQRFVPGLPTDSCFEVLDLGTGDFHKAVQFQAKNENALVVRYLNARFAAMKVGDQQQLFEHAWNERELLLRFGLAVAAVKIERQASVQERLWVVEKLKPLDPHQLKSNEREAGKRWLMELATRVWANNIFCIPDFKPANVGLRKSDQQYVLLDHREKPIEVGDELADLNQLMTLWGFSQEELAELKRHFMSATSHLPNDSRIKLVVQEFQTPMQVRGVRV